MAMGRGLEMMSNAFSVAYDSFVFSTGLFFRKKICVAKKSMDWRAFRGDLSKMKKVR
jgi:hypothetical protein